MNIKKASILILLILPFNNIYANISEHKKEVSVIYCTDLFHPPDDPDDHFDIACLYALQEIEIKAIILDQGQKQKKKPGSIPISQLNSIAGRNVPYASGLSDKLQSPQDCSVPASSGTVRDGKRFTPQGISCMQEIP